MSESSWAHALVLLTGSDLEHAAFLQRTAGHSCQVRAACPNLALYHFTFRFVASKKTGRIATRSRRACTIHAASLAQSHDLTLPEVAA